MSCKRLLYAPNIHQGGGKTLLLPVLESLNNDKDVVFVLDARMDVPRECILAGQVFRVQPTLFSRLWFEWRLRHLITAEMLVLCMGNLPPLFAHQGVQQVFVQNRYLIDDVSLNAFPVLVRIRLMIERWWLQSRSSHVNRFIVQTATMQRLVRKTLGSDAEALPFTAAMTDLESESSDCKKQYDFLYVATGEPHKNHRNLIDAWVLLASKGMYPSLCLTLDSVRFPKLCGWASGMIEAHHLNITMVGECTHEEIQYLYRISSAMIYPSLFESFGLPLIEAVKAGLPILASNASYVEDVIIPSDVFDPASVQSIADSVQAFRRTPATLNGELLDANEFVARTFRMGDAG